MNPLFRNFYNAIKDAIRAERQAMQAANLLAQSGRRDARARVAQARREAATARRQPRPIASSTWDKVMRSLGPLGEVIGAMVRPQARSLVGDVNRELKAAAELMARMGYELTAEERELTRAPVRPDSPGPVRGGGSTSPATPLRLPGESQRKSDEPGTGIGTWHDHRTIEIPGRQQPEVRSNTIIRVVNGKRYVLRRNSPLLTGEMIRVRSSNVHSIGYIWNDADPARGTLQVRFLDHRKERGAGRAGAGYQYFKVHPELFVMFMKAASKGKFVWDRLRVRGTVSGHQYQYSIATLASDGYTPRKARRIGDQEWYLKRRVTDRKGNVYVSQLPKQMVRSWNPRPNNGGPNRGTPNRGR